MAGLDSFTIEDSPDGASRPASRRSGTLLWRSSGCSTAGAGIDDASVAAQSNGSSARRCGSPATGLSADGAHTGGWAFEFHNDHYPDIDDTAEVVIALRKAARAGLVEAGADGACRRGVAWTLGMQSTDGGWGRSTQTTSASGPALPFCDFGEVTDPPSADVTAHVVEMLAGEPDADPVAMRRPWNGSAEQEPDGSWFGRWGVNHVYGTGAVLPALVAAGVDTADRRIRRAVAWSRTTRTPTADGGRTCAPTGTRHGGAAAARRRRKPRGPYSPW